MIVRTLEVPASATLAVVHEALLVCFGCSGECLHKFTVRAAGYSSDWMVDATETRDVTIDSLGLRVGERFTWRYDFLSGWVIDLRVEAVSTNELATVRCVSGRPAGPRSGVVGRPGSGVGGQPQPRRVPRVRRGTARRGSMSTAPGRARLS